MRLDTEEFQGLPSEHNSPDVRREIESCVADLEPHQVKPFFEHGHWWAHCNCGATWSVVDVDRRGEHSFEFEQVDDGDEDYHQDDEDYRNNSRPNPKRAFHYIAKAKGERPSVFYHERGALSDSAARAFAKWANVDKVDLWPIGNGKYRAAWFDPYSDRQRETELVIVEEQQAAMRPNTTVRFEKKWKVGDAGAEYEFDVKFGTELRGVNISDEDLELETRVAVQTFARELRKDYPWIGRVFLTGRSGGWLAIEDRTGGATREQIEAISGRVDEAHAAFAQAIRETFGYGGESERAPRAVGRTRARRPVPLRRLRRNASGDAIVLDWDEMTKDLGLPSYVAARDEALRDDASEEEAEEIGEKARESAWEEFGRDAWNQYESAVDHAAEITYGHVGLTYTNIGQGKVELSPKKSWEDVAEQLRELINGVGYFEFGSLEEFIESGPYKSPKDVVENHLHWVKDYAAVYGDTSAERLYERAMR